MAHTRIANEKRARMALNNNATCNRKWHYRCRDEKIRTSDLQHPMLARYLATLHPERLVKPQI